MTPEQFYSESKWPEMKDKFDKSALKFSHDDLCQFANDYAQQELQAENNMKTEWISVKEKLPEDGQTVIVWNRRLNRFGVDTFNLCMPKCDDFYFWAKHGIDNVTHWMIPIPPDDLEITAR